MRAFQITDNIFAVGVLNPTMRVFDIVMQTEYGTSYNSYLVKGKDKIALIDAVHASFLEEFLGNISSVVNPAQIDYIIQNHNEPDHSGALEKLTQYAPNAQLVSSQAGKIYLKNIMNSDREVQVVRDGESLDLGGMTLQFINAPLLHWPDSMFTYIPEKKIVFTCDFLGAHFCEPRYLAEKLSYPSKYEDAFRYYYDGIFSPFKQNVLAGLAKLNEVDAEIICPSHGPILTQPFIDAQKEKYYEWSTPKKNTTLTVPVFYTSAYGCTKALAEQIALGVQEADQSAMVTLYDLLDHPHEAMVSALHTSDVFFIGSPTINRDAVAPVWKLLSHIDAISQRGKKCVAFGSYGWSGEAVPNIIARLRGLKLDVSEESPRAVFVPSQDELAQARAYARGFIESLH
jgi:flavorubredoxin